MIGLYREEKHLANLKQVCISAVETVMNQIQEPFKLSTVES
jgi:hypothetical protein